MTVHFVPKDQCSKTLNLAVQLQDKVHNFSVFSFVSFQYGFNKHTGLGVSKGYIYVYIYMSFKNLYVLFYKHK